MPRRKPRQLVFDLFAWAIEDSVSAGQRLEIPPSIDSDKSVIGDALSVIRADTSWLVASKRTSSHSGRLLSIRNGGELSSCVSARSVWLLRSSETVTLTS